MTCTSLLEIHGLTSLANAQTFGKTYASLFCPYEAMAKILEFVNFGFEIKDTIDIAKMTLLN